MESYFYHADESSLLIDVLWNTILFCINHLTNVCVRIVHKHSLIWNKEINCDIPWVKHTNFEISATFEKCIIVLTVLEIEMKGFYPVIFSLLQTTCLSSLYVCLIPPNPDRNFEFIHVRRLSGNLTWRRRFYSGSRSCLK
jgi:hypothetical protein